MSRPHAVVVASLAAFAFAFAFAFASAASAAPLTVAKVAAPAVNCIFQPSCKLTVADTVALFQIPGAAGQARLQSRTFQGAPGPGGKTLYGYLYRVDLGEVSAAAATPPCVWAVKVSDAKGVSSQVDYDKNGSPDDAMAITAGGLGAIVPTAESDEQTSMIFRFAPGVCAGAKTGGSQSSVFFGFASLVQPTPAPDPVFTSVQLTPGGPWIPVAGRGPQICAIFKAC